MNLKKRRVSLTDILLILLKPDNIVTDPYFPSVLRENTEIQAEFGADNTETFEYEYLEWTISFKPDQVYDDMVLEFKTMRPYTKGEEQMEFAYLQGLLQAYMMGKPKFKIAIVYYNPSTGEKILKKEVVFQMDKQEAERCLEEAIHRFEELRRILSNKIKVNIPLIEGNEGMA
jgi:hypothetical protein